jgi:alkanesulfonate monooxygenase SsuD/methylene tetrahydromethanopterin reductase-like flavin-dependent oxidoreductase (luciferase family)
MTAMPLGPFGFTIDPHPQREHLAAAGEIERLGFTTLWISGGKLDALDRLSELIDVTERALIGPAIITPQVYDADEVTEFYHRVEAAAPGRLLVGLGSPHTKRPLTDLGDYLDRLGGADNRAPTADVSVHTARVREIASQAGL